MAIARFRAALIAIQTAELERLYNRLPKLNEESREEIRRFSERLVANVFDPPVKSLRIGTDADNGSTVVLVDALQRLFQLNRITEPAPMSENLVPRRHKGR
jgi:glutamyl-tRNA reductase